MNTSKLKAYAPSARKDFISAVKARATLYGITEEGIKEVTEQGDTAIIGGKAFSKVELAPRRRLAERVYSEGYQAVVEAAAYTWFNRLVALRYMELHNFLDHGFRVLSHPESKQLPEILDNIASLSFPGTPNERLLELKLCGDKDEELYREIIIGQCRALSRSLPFMNSGTDDPYDILLPDNLLHTDSLIRKLVDEIPEEDWKDVEIIGWLYQFYISEKKDEVIGKVVKSEDIPAATQLFTPNWIVKYLVQNTLGRKWMATYPNSSLKEKIEYYIEPAEQTAEVQQKLREITPDSLNPEEITFLDPACGSGHILVEAYDIFKAIYLERGYRLKEIPRLILEKNMYGLEIDDRAAQLTCFALLMKARSDDRSIMNDPVAFNIVSIKESNRVQIGEALETLKKFGADEDTAKLLLHSFKDAKTFGSLIRLERILVSNIDQLKDVVRKLELQGNLFEARLAPLLKELIRQTEILGRKFDCVVANPPYMGSKYQIPLLKKFLKEAYKGAEKDLFSASAIAYLKLAHQDGQLGIMCPFVWMFISSYEEFRRKLLTEKTLTSLVQLEYSGFAGATVPICTFTLQNSQMPEYTGSFIRLSDFVGSNKQAPKTLEAIRNPKCGWLYRTKQSKFFDIPGAPIAYWVDEKIVELFRSKPQLSSVADVKTGMQTGDNVKFLRYWFEIEFRDINLLSNSFPEQPKRWFLYSKGGDYRRWYGNTEHVVDWLDDGAGIRNCVVKKVLRSRVREIPNYFRKAASWSFVSSSNFGCRYKEASIFFDVAGSCALERDVPINTVLAFLCSDVARMILLVLNPTLNFQIQDISNLPYVKLDPAVETIASELISISKRDWNFSEVSWAFETLPIFMSTSQQSSMEKSCNDISEFYHSAHKDAVAKEEEVEAVVISAYELEDVIKTKSTEDKITLRTPNTPRDIEELISYSIGCMMGRYSLDKPGLIYANSGNLEFDPSKYKSFPADDDGIVPITDSPWFADDAANRFEEFISVAWPKDYLEENLKFVAEHLSPKNGESARDTVRRYFATAFYKNHLQMYKKRPIYWLFTSGKARAFQCLVYLHRYNEGTLARMRTQYVIPLQGKINFRLEKLEGDISASTSTAHRKQLESEQSLLKKHRLELQTFDEKLRHYADIRIALDLDDGVKVNYGKFGDLLAEVKTVTGGKAE